MGIFCGFPGLVSCYCGCRFMETVSYLLMFKTGFSPAIISIFEQDSIIIHLTIAAVAAGPVVFATLPAHTEPRSPEVLLPVLDPAVATKLRRDPDKK